MSADAGEIARQLARNAEAVCRHYLPNGHRRGNYWRVGDVAGSAGGSLYVRLHGPESGRGGAGKWTDAATGEHGDLLDLIAANRSLSSFSDVLAEARTFLKEPRTGDAGAKQAYTPAPPGSPVAARRLFAASRPIAGTLAEIYLRRRGLTGLRQLPALRFHPDCYVRVHDDAPPEAWPALVAAITDERGDIQGVHRTFLDPALAGDGARLSHDGKAPFEEPRRAMGALLGHGVRFGVAGEAAIAGEGIETMLSVRAGLPAAPVIACLSANHLAAFLFPANLQRLYVAREPDDAGDFAFQRLQERGLEAGVEVLALAPRRDDFNDDLRLFGEVALREALLAQLRTQDIATFARSR